MKTLLIKLISLFFCIIIITGCTSLVKRKHYNAVVGEKIVQIAARYQGSPYKYGGDDTQRL